MLRDVRERLLTCEEDPVLLSIALRPASESLAVFERSDAALPAIAQNHGRLVVLAMSEATMVARQDVERVGLWNLRPQLVRNLASMPLRMTAVRCAPEPWRQ